MYCVAMPIISPKVCLTQFPGLPEPSSFDFRAPSGIVDPRLTDSSLDVPEVLCFS